MSSPSLQSSRLLTGVSKGWKVIVQDVNEAVTTTLTINSINEVTINENTVYLS